MFLRSEWLKDAKFKSLVASDQTDWCLKLDRKAKVKVHSLVSDSVTVTLTASVSDTDSDTDSGSDNDCINDVRIAISFSTSGSQCMANWP